MSAPLISVRVRVNGRAYTEQVPARLLLSDFLRDRLRLTGTHVGCEHGVCGACTVIVDGAAVRSCLLFAAQMHDHEIQTVEGLADGDTLNPLQEAFREHHGLQCGFCTPGFLMTLTCFLRECPNPSEAQVREAISGNLCRCTGYQNIVAAALAAAQSLAAMPRS
jgi:carbon-monoxide dehydrogenase small subunit